jgi:hypothetical protein
MGSGCAPARYARLRSAGPHGGLEEGSQDHLQKQIYTPSEQLAFQGLIRLRYSLHPLR